MAAAAGSCSCFLCLPLVIRIFFFPSEFRAHLFRFLVISWDFVWFSVRFTTFLLSFLLPFSTREVAVFCVFRVFAPYPRDPQVQRWCWATTVTNMKMVKLPPTSYNHQHRQHHARRGALWSFKSFAVFLRAAHKNTLQPKYFICTCVSQSKYPCAGQRRRVTTTHSRLSHAPVIRSC